MGWQELVSPGVPGVPEVHGTLVHEKHMNALHMGVWPRVPGAGSKTGVYLEYLKLCLKLYRKLSIYPTHIPDLLSRPVDERSCL